jgi:hypothetical protein
MFIPIAFLGICAFIIALSIPLIQKKIENNEIYGFTLKKSMSNDERWYKSNCFAGWTMAISAIISILLLSAILIFKNKIDKEDIPLYSASSVLIPLLLSMVASSIYLKKLP